MSHRRLGLLFVCVIVILAPFVIINPAPVQADIAPPQPPLGSSIFPGQEITQVRMLAEKVLIDLPSSSIYDNWQAAVTAVFTMRNLGDSPERMTVRFPMFMTEQYVGADASCTSHDTNYPAIQNFRALADEIPLEVNIIEETLHLSARGEPIAVNKPCWAEFPIAFPVGKVLKVEVRYLIQGQLDGHGVTNYLDFPYVLTTGHGWRGTIGSADIRVRLPYPANEMNVTHISEGGRIDGREVRWYFEDFEPDRNTFLLVVNPRIWQALQDDLSNIKAHPQDGETWGRIGKNYKNIFLFERGFRQDVMGEELFRRSQEAYQKSVALLPKDADWHYGFGDLLCTTAFWREYITETQLPSAPDLFAACMSQLQLALQINPAHVKTLELLQWMSNLEGIVDLSGSKPDFLILTPGNYHTPTPWETITQISTSTSTATAVPTATPSPLPSLTLAPSVTPTIVEPDAGQPTLLSEKQKAPSICGAIFLPLLLGLWLGWKKLASVG